jgi:DNA-binding transcriptional ArsR family regulator
MELTRASLTLAALAQPSRLEVFRLLVSSDTELCAGEIANRLDLPKSTLSFHLKELTHAGLVEARRDARSIIYRVRAEGIRELLGFLTEDCCQGRPELCMPSASEQRCASTNT